MEKAFYVINFSMKQIPRELDPMEPGNPVQKTKIQVRTNFESCGKQSDSQPERVSEPV